MGNVRIAFTDTDSAVSTSQIPCYHWLTDERMLLAPVRYRDDFVRQDGVWRISKRDIFAMRFWVARGWASTAARSGAWLPHGPLLRLAPEQLSGKLVPTGVELDATTARIAKLLYLNARIRHEDFTKARLPEHYDLAIGNPPFSDRTVRADGPAGQLRLSLHDYFIARSIERLRPGPVSVIIDR